MTEQEFMALEPRERDAVVAEARGWNVRGMALVWEDESGCINIDHPENPWRGRAPTDCLRPVYAKRELVADPNYFGKPLLSPDDYPDDPLMQAHLIQSNQEDVEWYKREIALWGTLEHTLEPVPEFTVRIAAAWELVDEMEAEGFEWMVSDDEVYFEKGRFDDPTSYQFGCSMLEGSSESPLAICIAYLKARRVIVV